MLKVNIDITGTAISRGRCLYYHGAEVKSRTSKRHFAIKQTEYDRFTVSTWDARIAQQARVGKLVRVRYNPNSRLTSFVCARSVYFK